MTDISECNCGNCGRCVKQSFNITGNIRWVCEIRNEIVDPWDHDLKRTKVVGCLSHPKAREVLMADVINTIEMRIEAAEQVRKTHNLTGGNLFVTLYKDMLDLIRRGSP